MWLLQADRRVRDDPHISQCVMDRRMDHAWMEQIYGPDRPSYLYKSLIVLHQLIISTDNMTIINH